MKRRSTRAWGRRFERQAKRYAQRLGYEILRSNYWLGRVEVDLLAWDPIAFEWVVIEVRGRLKEDGYERLGAAKIKKLTWFSKQLSQESQFGIRIELFEVTRTRRFFFGVFSGFQVERKLVV